MKKVILTISILLNFIVLSYAQTEADSLYMKKVFGGYQFLQGEKVLNMNQLTDIMKPNAQAYKEIKAAKTNYSFALILGGAGGFMVGLPIGTAMGGGEPNWTMAGIGAGLIIASIPISIKFNKQAKKAIETYNQGLRTSSHYNNKELKIAMTSNGLGITLNF